MKGWHFYNSRLAKVPWFIRRFGLRQLLSKPYRWVFGPRIVRGLPIATFSFEDEVLPCFYHTYNMTWVNERMIEVPIGMKYLAAAKHGKILEIGNVLSNYYPTAHAIVDKFEVGPNIINCDILDYKPPLLYDLILSISTFEHIGFDDDVTTASRVKIPLAVNHARSLLSREGMLVLTLPIGYNPDLDALLQAGKFETLREHYLERTAYRAWAATTKSHALKAKINRPFPYANAVAVLEFGPIR